MEKVSQNWYNTFIGIFSKRCIMSKSSKQIEEDAVDYLKMALKKSKHINREISEGDK